MISRRHFLSQTLSVAALATPLALRARPELPKKGHALGFISGIVGNELKSDWQKTLKTIAGMGYTEMETGRHLGESPAAFLSFCNDIGITPVGGGIPMKDEHDALQTKLDELNALNLRYAIVYWPWFVSAPFKLDDCKRSAATLNTIGEACRKRGLDFCWHNHDREFHPMEEGLPFDYLMAHTDKNTVKCEMDVYWVAKGGADPVAVLQRYPGRFQALHLKDMAPGDDQDFACPGSGILDFPGISKEASRQGIKHFMVERDKVQDGIACLQTSSAYLKRIAF